MAVRRISNINVKNNTSLFTAVYGNIANNETFIDSDLKGYTLNQQLYLYLKSEGYTVLFYEQAAEYNIHSFSQDDVQKFISDYQANNPQKKRYVARNINSPFKQGRLNRTNNNDNTASNEYAIQEYIPTGHSSDTIYRTNRTSGIIDDLKRLFGNTDLNKKVAYIICNAEKCDFGEFANSYTALFHDLSNAYAKNGSKHKIFLLYHYLDKHSLEEAFNSSINSSKFFFENAYKQMFLQNGELKADNSFCISLPDKEEIRNLLNHNRFKFNKEINWTDFDTMLDMLEKDNKTIDAFSSKFQSLSEFSMTELTKSGLVKSETTTLDLKKIQSTLDKIRGQKENIDIVIQKIKNWAKEKNKSKPLSFFLVGKSGTGKTFTAETFQKALIESGFSYVYLDMNAYKDGSTYSKLLGSAPGYVSSTETPKLFAEIKKNRRLIICFDEMEKAHPDIFTTLMQLVDQGELSNNNYTGNFKECILFFTSNLAQEKVIEAKNNLLKENMTTDILKLLKDTTFKNQIRTILQKAKPDVPIEVWNRVENYLVYNALSAKDVIEIAINLIREYAIKKEIIISQIAPEYLAYLAKRHSNTSNGMLRDLKTEIYDEITNLIDNQNENI
jgi:hypothetical protein